MPPKNKPTPLDQDLFDATPEGADAALITGDFVIDFGDPKTRGFEPLPAGLYNATVVKAEAKYSSAGNPMIALQWKITDGEAADRIVFDNLVFQENALWRVRQVLEAFGYPSNFGGQVKPDNLLGERATLQIIQQPIKKNGSTIDPSTNEAYGMQNSVKAVSAYGGARTVADLS